MEVAKGTHMIACEQARQVHLLHDGELSPGDAQALQGHLAQCAACAAELKRLRSLSRRIDTVERPRLPQIVRQRILAAAEREQERSITRLVNRFAAIAASLAVAGTVWTMAASHSVAVAPPDNWEQAAMFSVDSEGDVGVPMAEWVLADLRWEQPR
jgi:anti-sigma factor RsiW